MERMERTKPTDDHQGLRKRVGISGVAVPVEVLAAQEPVRVLPGCTEEANPWAHVVIDDLSHHEYLEYADAQLPDCTD